MDKEYINNIKDTIKEIELEILEKQEKLDDLIDKYQKLKDIKRNQ